MNVSQLIDNIHNNLYTNILQFYLDLIECKEGTEEDITKIKEALARYYYER